jgi:hypothetical protein
MPEESIQTKNKSFRKAVPFKVRNRDVRFDVQKGSSNVYISGFGGIEVACWPLVPKFAGSHPAEAVGFLLPKKKSSARLPSEGK